jgi:hypothetical protein
MKQLRYLLTGVLVLLLAGCFEIQEQIDIKPDGTGALTVNTDMSKLLEVMQNYMGKEEMEKEIPAGKTLDTTVMMRSLVDTMQNISAESKELVKDGKVHMQLNLDQKIFKSDIHIPFSSQENLQKLYNNMNNQNLGFSQLFKGMTAKKDTAEMNNAITDSPSGNEPDNGKNAPDMNQFNAIYDFTSHDGLISRKLNEQKWKDLQQTPQFAQTKDVTNMGITIPYTLTIHLPRPAKKIDNALAKLSPDKKQVVIQYNLLEVFDHPEKFEFTIDY